MSRSLSRWTIAFIGFLALAVQSLVVQAHIHIPQTAGGAQSVSLATLVAKAVTNKARIAADNFTTGSRDKYPINEDPSKCPLCQAIAHFGQYVHGVAGLTVPSVPANPTFIVFDDALPSLLAASHNWQGRAPPADSIIF